MRNRDDLVAHERLAAASEYEMRVLILIDSLGRSGSEVSLAANLTHYCKAGIEPIIACLEEREGVSSRVRAAGYDVRVLPESRISVGSSLFDSLLTRARALRRIIRTEKPALVHTTLPQANLVGRVAAAGTGVPVLTSLVNTRYRSERFRDPNVTPWKMRVLQFIDGISARLLTDHFHAVTHAVKAAAVEDLGLVPEKISVVERGRDTERLGPPVFTAAGQERRRRARRKLDLLEEAQVLLNVGRQEHQKGHEHLLEAFEKLADAHPEAVLLVAGRRGHASARLDQIRAERPVLRKAEQAGRLRFLGHRDDVPELLAAADVFVFPSLYEGIGGAVIEAMAVGLPVVASDIAPMREVCETEHRAEGETRRGDAGAPGGGNALLFTPGEPGALAEAAATLLSDARRREALGRRSRALFDERFTLEVNARRMAQLFYRVAGRHLPGDAGPSDGEAGSNAASNAAGSTSVASASST